MFGAQVRRIGKTGSIVLLAGGTALGQAIVLLATPVLLRLYSPAEYGVLSIYLSILAVLCVVTSIRYELAILLPAEDEDAANLLALSLIIVSLLSLLLGLVILSTAGWIVSIANLSIQPHHLLWLPLGFLGAGTYQVFNYWAVRKSRFSDVARTKVSQSLGMVLTQLGMGLLGVGTSGLLLGNAIGRAMGSATLGKLTWRNDRTTLGWITLEGIRRVAIRYSRFSVLSSGVGLLNGVGTNVPLLFLASAYGTEVVGWYMLGNQMMGGPLDLIGSAANQVFMAESAVVSRSSPWRLAGLFAKNTTGLLLMALPITLGAALVAPWLFPFVFGGKWAQSGIFLQRLAPMFLLRVMAFPADAILDVLQRQDLQLLREVLRMVLLSGAVIIARLLDISPANAIAILSLAGSLSYIILIPMSYHAIAVRNRENRFGYSESQGYRR